MSSDTRPGPTAAMVSAATQSTMGYANAGGPAGHRVYWGATAMALTITPITAAAASGVSSPAARPRPPTISEAPARAAKKVPGSYPCWARARPVASSPAPPNMPNSFCAP
ncbi:hypothetical protein GCM10020295_26820 [Streptomyces cinereospinus]